MSKAGQNNYKGINNQAFSSLSLFLQNLRRADFTEMIPEGEKLEDFVMVYDSGKRVICESKIRKNGLKLSNLKEILDTVINNGKITDKDELLIISDNVDDKVKSIVNNYIFLSDQYKQELRTKSPHFNDKHFHLLSSQVKIWEVSQIENRDAILLFMYQAISTGGSFWVPKDVLENWVNSILITDIYLGSQNGKHITRNNFLDKLDAIKQEYLKNNGTSYNEARSTNLKKIEDVIKLVNEQNPNKRAVCANAITELVANPTLHYEVLKRLTAKNDLVLRFWEQLWLASASTAYSLELFKIFERNIANDKNQEFIFKFINKILDEYLINYFREDFVKKDIVDLCKNIFSVSPGYLDKIFKVIKKLYVYKSSRFLYDQKHDDESWEREEISELLKQLYSQSHNQTFNKKVVDFILTNFNIVEDDGKFWHYTPPQLFNILSDYVKEKPAERILWLSKLASKQYQKFYQRFGKKTIFKGWEHMGGGISQSGSEFAISDRHFVTQVIKPSLQRLYEEDKEKAWKFISENCVARKLSDVSKNQPDFLNRTALGILFQEYRNGKHSKESFEILSDFVKMRNGIPWKADLIFQELRGDYTDEQKWSLVQVSLNEFNKLPVNVFVEQIVSDLATKSEIAEIRQQAIDILKNWTTNPEYQKRHSYGELDTVDSALKLINNPDSREEGIKILESYIESDHLKFKRDTFDTYDVANTLTRVLEEDIERGLSILNKVIKADTLSVNQQILICSSLYKTNDNKPEILKSIFDRFVKPLLSQLIGKKIDEVGNLAETDIKPIEERFNYRYARESLVQFSEKLARAGYKHDALWMAKIFINDSDPSKDGSNYPDDPKGEFNEHARVARGEKDLAIRTVRGYLAWTLQKLIVPFSNEDQKTTREIIPDCVKLVKQLCFDTNYYVRAEGCIPLIELVKNRHTHLPGKPNERFISEELAGEMESIAFEMLTEENIGLKQIARHLAMVFAYIRTLGTQKAKMVIQTFLKSDDEDVISEILPLFVYYSFFRQNAFPTWQWKPLEQFNQTEIQLLLENQLKNGSPKVRAQLAWQFERLPDEIKKTPEDRRSLTVEDAVKLSARQMTLLLNKYDHDVFNDIYRFIEDYYQEYFEICYGLWTKCISMESDYFKKNWSEDKLQEVYWWPFFYNGMILEAVLDKKGVQEFLDYFKKLADYPVPVLIANDLDRAVERLVPLTKHKGEVGNLFDVLIKRNPKYYEYKQRWIENNNV